MSNFVAVRDGGKSSEEAAMRALRKISSNGQGNIGQNDLLAGQHGGGNNQVDIAVGDIFIAYQNYGFYAWSDAVNTLTISNNTSGNPRIDVVVAYIDLAVVSSASNNNPNAFKFMLVSGTPAGSPSVPSGPTIQAAVGAGNPYYSLSKFTVPNGFNSGSSMTVFTDLRTRYLAGSSGSLPPFEVSGTMYVVNGLGRNWSVPPGVSAINRLDANCLIAPTGSGLTLRLYNLTQTHDIGTVTIAAGSTVASNTSMTNPSVSTGDVIRFDCTAIGSTVPGSDPSVTPSA